MVVGNWEDLVEIINIFTTYYTGSYLLTGVCFLAFFFITMIMYGIEFKYAILFCFPLLVTFMGIGWLVQILWLQPVVLVIIGLFYAFVIIRMMER